MKNIITITSISMGIMTDWQLRNLQCTQTIIRFIPNQKETIYTDGIAQVQFYNLTKKHFLC